MPVTSQNGKTTEDGQEKDALIVTFTNGAKQQLEDLQAFYKTPDNLEVIKLAIGLLQKFKETDQKKTT